MRGGGPRHDGPHVRGRRASLRAGARQGPRARDLDAVRGPPRRRVPLATGPLPPPRQRHSHHRPRRALPDRLRLLPGGAPAHPAVQPRARRGSSRQGGRRAIHLRPAHDHPAAGGVAGPPALARRPGLRRRRLERDAALHRVATRHQGSTRAAGGELRGVRPPVPGLMERPAHPVDPLHRLERDDLRRPRRARRLEHVRVVGRRHPQAAVVARAHRRRLHVLLDLPAPRQPLADRARRRPGVLPDRRRGGGRPAGARAGRARRPRRARDALELPPRPRQDPSRGDRLARRPRAGRTGTAHGRHRGMGVRRAPRLRRLRPRPARHLGAVPARPGHAPPRAVERARLRRGVGPPRPRGRRSGSARPSTSSTGRPSIAPSASSPSSSARSPAASAGIHRRR